MIVDFREISMSEENVKLVEKIMLDFSESTGISDGSEKQSRFLWSDSFALINFLELYRQTGNEKFKDSAFNLLNQVHNVLGFHREDDQRSGRISGFSDEDGEKHPTIRGLRIGKSENERKISEPCDEKKEVNRDGQYFHYLTKWIHALNLLSKVTSNQLYNDWAIELVKGVHPKFVYFDNQKQNKSIYRKMSIDLSYPLVAAMRELDSLDGYISYNQLRSSAEVKNVSHDLTFEISDMLEISKGCNWNSENLLEIGELLSNSYRLAQLIVKENLNDFDLLNKILESALYGLEGCAKRDYLSIPAEFRVPYREFSLSIGLSVSDLFKILIEEHPDTFKGNKKLMTNLALLGRNVRLKSMIEKFWMDDSNKRTKNWIEYKAINTAMLATSLMPEGFLKI